MNWKERLRRKRALELAKSPPLVWVARRIPAMELPDYLNLGWHFAGHDGDRLWSTHVFVEASFLDVPDSAEAA